MGVLEIRGLTKSYGAVKVLNGLELDVTECTLRCLLGPNGAGKTTAMDMITGRQRADEGSIVFDGNEIRGLREDEIARRGVGRKFQIPSVVKDLSVLENFLLAAADDVNPIRNMFRFGFKKVKTRIDDTAERVGLRHRLHLQAGYLSHGETQWLEIGMVLMQNPKLLLMDEPAAGMTEHEAEKTVEIFNDLKKTHTLLVVEHDMAFVRSIADSVTVMHMGRVLAEGTMAQIETDPEVRRVYLGTEELEDAAHA
ncbi:urea ABC transporter ATP-binding protein UrtD [Acidocella sp.]|uniref:urea ABC transporter ATP-binding protein UrtD n=1 Tax=Acidocella sp. TaxID=50710 RepID=UPI003D05A087